MRKLFAYIGVFNRTICNAFVKYITLLLNILHGAVKFGKGCRFRGFARFAPSLNGKIVIGKNCTFNSSETSNMMGLNHKYIISTSDAAGNRPVLTIGNNCGFSGVSIWCFKSITIGNNVRVGANSMIIDGDAHFNDQRTSAPESIVVEDNVFIGADCIIRKGVTIGKNSVIGMRSMVLHDIPANCIAVGNPAKVIKVL